MLLKNINFKKFVFRTLIFAFFLPPSVSEAQSFKEKQYNF